MPRFAALALCFLLPLLALAEPATVRRFEVSVHAAPDSDSEVIGTLIENQQVSVSETAEAGFRRVRMEDGAVGWVEEAALSFAAPSAEASTDAVPSAESTALRAYPDHAPLREQAEAPAPRIYVQDLWHLAELTREDTEVGPMARALAQRHTAALVTQLGSIALGTVALAGALLLPRTDCETIGSNEYCSMGPTHFGLIISAPAITLTGYVVGEILKPRRKDLLKVINAWNTRHPTDPFELGR